MFLIVNSSAIFTILLSFLEIFFVIKMRMLYICKTSTFDFLLRFRVFSLVFVAVDFASFKAYNLAAESLL